LVENTNVNSRKIQIYSDGSYGETDENMHIIKENKYSRNAKSKFQSTDTYRSHIKVKTLLFDSC
jgi:hypothetical protein